MKKTKGTTPMKSSPPGSRKAVSSRIINSNYYYPLGSYQISAGHEREFHALTVR